MFAPPALDFAADYADQFATRPTRQPLTAGAVAALLLAASQRQPAWLRGLLQLRTRLVALVGLKPTAPAGSRIGPLPVREWRPDGLVLGKDEVHLNFRVLALSQQVGPDCWQLTLRTLVKFNSRWGRRYFALIKPFHQLVMRVLIGRINASLGAPC